MEDDQLIVRATKNYVQESDDAKRSRIEQNEENFDCYHMKQDFSYKKKGQSKEFLPKQSIVVEQVSTFFQQGLVDIGDWFNVEKRVGATEGQIKAKDVKNLVRRGLDKAKFIEFVGDTAKVGLLGSLMIAKVHNDEQTVPYFVTEKNEEDGSIQLKKRKRKYWKLGLATIFPKDFHIDPTGRGLYRGNDEYFDLWELKKMAEDENSDFDKAVLEEIAANSQKDAQKEAEDAKRQGQDVTHTDYRRQVKLTEMWGTILDPDSGDVLHENVRWVVANDTHLLVKPHKNRFWHGEDPYVVTPIIRVPKSVWGKALMDAGTKLNFALNEIYNLMFDSGMMSVHGIKQARVDWMEDPSQASDGLAPTDVILANSSTPPGGKVVERVDTGGLSEEAIAIFDLTTREFRESVLSSDLRVGAIPNKEVTATEVLESSNSITSIFTGVSKVLELNFIEPVVEKSWMTMLQHMDDMDDAEVKNILGEERAALIQAMTPEQRFAESALGFKFKIFGISRTLAKTKDFRKLTALLQTISSSEVFIESYLQMGFTFGNMLEQIMRALDIDTEKLKDQGEDQEQMIAQQLMQSLRGEVDQSQIPQAGGGNLNETIEGSVPRDGMANQGG